MTLDVKALSHAGDLTCLAWNPVSDPYIFATGSHDGVVRIWNIPDGGDGSPSRAPRELTSAGRELVVAVELSANDPESLRELEASQAN